MIVGWILFGAAGVIVEFGGWVDGLTGTVLQLVLFVLAAVLTVGYVMMTRRSSR